MTLARVCLRIGLKMDKIGPIFPKVAITEVAMSESLPLPQIQGYLFRQNAHINQFVKSQKSRVFVDMIHLSEVGVALKKPASSTSTSNPFQISCSQLEHHLSRQPRPCSRMSFSGFVLLSGWKEPRLGISWGPEQGGTLWNFEHFELFERTTCVTWYHLIQVAAIPPRSCHVFDSISAKASLRHEMLTSSSVQAAREWDDIVHRENGFLEPVFFFFSQQFYNQIWENSYKP